MEQLGHANPFVLVVRVVEYRAASGTDQRDVRMVVLVVVVLLEPAVLPIIEHLRQPPLDLAVEQTPVLHDVFGVEHR